LGFPIDFDLIYLRIDMLLPYSILWFKCIAFDLFCHLLIWDLYLYWYLPCYFQLLPGGVDFLPTPPGRSWFPSNSSREELVSSNSSREELVSNATEEWTHQVFSGLENGNKPLTHQVFSGNH
jgi:hypothetical protein